MAERAPDHESVLRRHGYQSLRVLEVVQETSDVRTFVLDVPADLAEVFSYRAGQFCTVRVHAGGDEDVLRCYSMSSAPATDDRLAVTVKRVPGGLMSNWLHDHVAVGDQLELAPPAGVFGERDGYATILAFCGGSGVTPVFSIVKQALATGDRRIRMLYANRDRDAVIFRDELAGLEAAQPGRLSVRHHIDAESGYLTAADIAEFVDGDTDAQVLVCGPAPFMDLVVDGVAAAGIPDEQVAIERFVNAEVVGDATAGTPPAARAPTGERTRLTVKLKGRRHILDHVAGDTVLEATRRAGLKAPSSCELGNCASCMALVTAGRATMRVNNALTPDEVEEGWVLTCQALPVGPEVAIEYDDL